MKKACLAAHAALLKCALNNGWGLCPAAKVVYGLTCKAGPAELCGICGTKHCFAFYFPTGHLVPYPAGCDIRGEDHSKDGQDGD